MKYVGPPQSGSVANQTASRNQFGQYYRNRVVPTDPATTAQITSRTFMASAVAGWQALSDDQRQAWNEFAIATRSRPGFPAAAPLSGFQAFVRSWRIGNQYFSTIVTDPPTSYGPIFTLSEASVSLSLGVMDLSWTATSGAMIAYFATAPVSSSIAFSTAKRPALLGSFAGAPPVSVASDYAARFGALPLTGQAVFFLFREVTIALVSKGLVVRAVQP